MKTESTTTTSTKTTSDVGDDIIPRPPELPPPPSLLTKMASKETAKPPLAKTTATSATTTTTPERNVVEKPQKKVASATTTTGAPKPTVEKPKEKDDKFIFSEVSLKNFVSGQDAVKEKSRDNLDEEMEEKAPQDSITKKKTVEERQKAKEAKKKVTKAKPGATISLGLLGWGQQAGEGTPKKVSAAPRGVPTLSRWRQNRDGSISGSISGSIAFRDGDAVTTSPIRGKPVGGSVATTVSGSRYVFNKGHSFHIAYCCIDNLKQLVRTPKITDIIWSH